MLFLYNSYYTLDQISGWFESKNMFYATKNGLLGYNLVKLNTHSSSLERTLVDLTTFLLHLTKDLGSFYKIVWLD